MVTMNMYLLCDKLDTYFMHSIAVQIRQFCRLSNAQAMDGLVRILQISRDSAFDFRKMSDCNILNR